MKVRKDQSDRCKPCKNCKNGHINFGELDENDPNFQICYEDGKINYVWCQICGREFDVTEMLEEYSEDHYVDAELNESEEIRDEARDEAVKKLEKIRKAILSAKNIRFPTKGEE